MNTLTLTTQFAVVFIYNFYYEKITSIERKICPLENMNELCRDRFEISRGTYASSGRMNSTTYRCMIRGYWYYFWCCPGLKKHDSWEHRPGAPLYTWPNRTVRAMAKSFSDMWTQGWSNLASVRSNATSFGSSGTGPCRNGYSSSLQ